MMPAAPTTLKQAAAMLAAMQFTAPDPMTLQRISQEEGETFKTAIVKASSTSPEQPGARDYLKAVLTAYSVNTRSIFNAMGLEGPDPQAILPIIKTEGRAFRAAISALMADAGSQEAATYLKTAVAHLNLRQIVPNAPPANNVKPMQPPPRAQKPASNEDVPLPPPEGESTKADIISTHLYGGRGAFCFTKDTTQTGSYPTITIDAAKAVPGAERKYDWKNKIVFQLTVGELPLVYGVFLGLLSELRLVGHGKANNKSLSIEVQEKNYYLTLNMGRESVAIPAYSKDSYRIMTMLYEQMKANSPTVDASVHMAIIKRVCERHINPEKRSQQNQQAAG